MSWSRMTLAIVLGASLAGCAGWRPSGAEAEPPSDPAVRVSSKNPAAVQLVVDPNLLQLTMPKGAESFMGGACIVAFRPYPELYAQAQQFLERVFARVDLTTPDKLVPGYSVVLVPSVQSFKWSSVGPTANAAAVEVQWTAVSGGKTATDSAYIMGSSSLDRWHQGCHDATVTATGAANRSIAFGMARLVEKLASAQLPAQGQLAPRNEAEQAVFLASINSARSSSSAFTDTSKGNQQMMENTMATLVALQAIQAAQNSGSMGGGTALSAMPVVATAQGAMSTGTAMGMPQVQGMGQNTISDAPAPVQAATPVSSGGNYRAAHECVRFDSTRGDGTYDRIVNDCNFEIFARWADAGYCRSVCGDSVRPGMSVTITPVRPPVNFVACEYPGSPVGPGGTSWRGGREYQCRG